MTVRETRAVPWRMVGSRRRGGLRGVHKLEKNQESVGGEVRDPGFEPSLLQSRRFRGLRSQGSQLRNSLSIRRVVF